jgi:hypothetical protein
MTFKNPLLTLWAVPPKASREKSWCVRRRELDFDEFPHCVILAS